MNRDKDEDEGEEEEEEKEDSRAMRGSMSRALVATSEAQTWPTCTSSAATSS